MAQGGTGYTYDPSTPVGQVRLLCTDRPPPVQAGPYDWTNVVFDDSEIQAFLTLNNGVVKLAAAQALDQLASSEAYIQGKVVLENLQVDGTVLAAALKAQAAELRRQYDIGEGDPTDPGYDYAEQLLDVFSERQIWINRGLRQQI